MIRCARLLAGSGIGAAIILAGGCGQIVGGALAMTTCTVAIIAGGCSDDEFAAIVNLPDMLTTMTGEAMANSARQSTYRTEVMTAAQEAQLELERPAMPPLAVMGLDPSAPEIGRVAAIHAELTDPAWIPDHVVLNQGEGDNLAAPAVEGELFCASRRGSAEILYRSTGTNPDNNIRLARLKEISCPADAESAVTEGVAVFADGSVWAGEMVIDRNRIVPVYRRQGVEMAGAFQNNKQDGQVFVWRNGGSEMVATAAPGGATLVRASAGPLFPWSWINRQYGYRISEPMARARLVVPDKGAFDGMVSAGNAFQFPNETSTDGNRYNFGHFYSADGSFRLLTNYDLKTAGPYALVANAVVVDMNDATRVDAYNVSGIAAYPALIETAVDSILGAPGAYVYTGRIRLSESPVLAAVFPDWAQARAASAADIDAVNARIRTQDARWRELEESRQASIRNMQQEISADQQIRAEQRARKEREQRELNAAILGAFSDVNSSYQRGTYDLNRQTVMNHQAMDSYSQGGTGYAAPPPTYDEWKAYQQSLASTASSSSSSRSSGSRSYSSSRSTGTTADAGDGIDEKRVTQDQAIMMMLGHYESSRGLRFEVRRHEVVIEQANSGGYRQYDAGEHAISGLHITHFQPLEDGGAHLRGTSDMCSYYMGEDDLASVLGGRTRHVNECHWSFTASVRSGMMTFGNNYFQGDRRFDQ